MLRHIDNNYHPKQIKEYNNRAYGKYQYFI